MVPDGADFVWGLLAPTPAGRTGSRRMVPERSTSACNRLTVARSARPLDIGGSFGRASLSGSEPSVLVDRRPADPSGAAMASAAGARGRFGQVGAAVVASAGGDEGDQVQGDQALCDVVQLGDDQVADAEALGRLARAPDVRGGLGSIEYQFVAAGRRGSGRPADGASADDLAQLQVSHVRADRRPVVVHGSTASAAPQLRHVGLMRGMNPVQPAQIVGHSSLAMIQSVYAHLTPQDAYAALEQISRGPDA
jgi:hypothetical protein